MVVEPPPTKEIYTPPQAIRLSKEEWTKFRLSLPTNTQLRLSESFGKDNIHQSFTTDVCFRHVLVFLFKSGFLSNPETQALNKSSKIASTMSALLWEHRRIDFSPIRGYDKFWEQRTSLEQGRRKMTTACFLYFNLEVPTVIRYLSGPHVAKLRDVPHTLRTAKPHLPTDLYEALSKVFTYGAPAKCIATSSDTNYREYLSYGNHKMLPPQLALLDKVLVKESKRGHVVLASNVLSLYTYNCHVTPYGVAVKEGKNDRPFSDASFRPTDHAMAVNDWTNKDDDLPVEFQLSERRFLTELYNYRISYPNEEIYIGDDDIQGAFKWVLLNTNLVGMHAFIVKGHMGFNTSQTFGGTTSPANYEYIARARKYMARHLYTLDDVIAQASPYVPPLETAPPPSRYDINMFALATKDSRNPGIVSEDGLTAPPGYNPYVDDTLYCSIAPNLLRTVSASILSIYKILGTPNPLTLDALSRDKLTTLYTHQRRVLGKMVDSRRLMVSLPLDKRETIVNILGTWLAQPSFLILEGAQLVGILDNISTMSRWGRTQYFALLNTFRATVKARYQILRRRMVKTNNQRLLQARLPPNLAKRVHSIFACKMAAALWKDKTAIAIDPPIHQQLQALQTYLSDVKNPWEQSIAHYIDRDPTFTTTGDASLLGTGAFSPDLHAWTVVDLSPDLQACTKLSSSNPRFVHINELEFVTIILQLAMAIARCEHSPQGLPEIPLLRILSDNTTAVSWAEKISSKSLKGQTLVRIYGELLHRSNIGVSIVHLPGNLNNTADLLSRPDVNSPALLLLRLPKLTPQEPRLASWDFFLPSPDLTLLLESALSSTYSPIRIDLPPRLGQFCPIVSSTSSSVSIPALGVSKTSPTTILNIPTKPSS